MTGKTVTVFGATGTAGSACVEELIRLRTFNVQVLARKRGQQEKRSALAPHGDDAKQRLYARWRASGVEIKFADATDHAELIPALRGTDYLVSCVPINATESQYPLIWAAKEEGAEGMSLFAHWNKTFIPQFEGTPLDELFTQYIEPFLAEFRAQLAASGELPVG
jgi:uncharacterized protein YbjT (DUF2867 family)